MKEIVIKYKAITNFSLLSTVDKDLMKRASEVANSAYAPYSSFHVGAALILENDHVVVGNNQENSSFPCGICAERVALFSAGTNYPNLLIKKIAITAVSKDFNLENPVGPCGLCRQVLIECEDKQGLDIEIILFNKKQVIKLNKAKDLLPFFFKEEKLKRT